MVEAEQQTCSHGNALHCSPANLTVRKMRGEGSSPPSVQAPVEADRYQGVVTQWYSPLSLEEHTPLACMTRHFSGGSRPQRSPVLSSVDDQRVRVGVLALH